MLGMNMLQKVGVSPISWDQMQLQLAKSLH